MSVDVVIPAVGESITDGVLAKWHVRNGEWVEKGQPLLDFETDKITAEVPAPAAGGIELLAEAGATVNVGGVVARVDEAAQMPAGGKTHSPAAQPSAREQPLEEPKPQPRTAPAPASAEPAAIAAEKRPAAAPRPPAAEELAASAAARPSASAAAVAEKPAQHRLAPAARRMLSEAGLDPAAIVGSGRGGVITKPDVLKAMQSGAARPLESGASGVIDEGLKTIRALIRQPQPAPPVSAAAPAAQIVPREERVPMSRLRQTIAQRLVAAKNETAMLTTFNEVDMSAVLAIRSRYQERFVNKYDVKLGFMSFFVKACVDALKQYPAVNARLEDADIVYQHYHNIGIAVGTDKGLLVPVLRDAEHKTFAELEREIRNYAERARANKIEFDELRGGTFTITNGGIYGSMLSTPILNPPQVGILGMHNVAKRAIVIEKDGADEIAIRPMMYVALSYDHRLIDGKEAVGFLIRVKECIENPERMLLEL